MRSWKTGYSSTLDFWQYSVYFTYTPIGLDTEIMIVLDALRKQRNVADYSGDLVADSAVAECIDQAKQLWMKISEWLNHEHPDLLK